jgi:hypothetical protein
VIDESRRNDTGMASRGMTKRPSLAAGLGWQPGADSEDIGVALCHARLEPDTVAMPRTIEQTESIARLGLLAYGSLLWDRGPELEDVLDLDSPINGVETTFNVEFARSTTSRGGGPTLVPVATGGSPVVGAIFPFREWLPVHEAQTLVWRREVRRSSGRYDAQRNADHPDKVFVDAHEALHDEFDVVLVVRIPPNIEPLNGDELAAKAVLSARTEFGMDRKDGISYLIGAKDFGIDTPLRSDYESAILRKLDVTSLEEAWDVATTRSL